MDNITAAETQTAANGGLLAELAASLEVSVDTVARPQREIKRLTKHINALKKKITYGTNRATVPGGGGFLLASIAERLSKRRRIEKTNATLTC